MSCGHFSITYSPHQTKHKMQAKIKSVLLFVCVFLCLLHSLLHRLISDFYVQILFCISPTGVSVWFYVGQFDMESVLLWRMAVIVVDNDDDVYTFDMPLPRVSYVVSVSHNNLIRDRVKVSVFFLNVCDVIFRVKSLLSIWWQNGLLVSSTVWASVVYILSSFFLKWKEKWESRNLRLGRMVSCCCGFPFMLVLNAVVFFSRSWAKSNFEHCSVPLYCCC